MRRTLILLPLLLLSFSSLWASDRWRVSILASEISTPSNEPWSEDPHAGISVGLAYAPTPLWDVELTVGSQRHRSPYTRLFYSPLPGGPGQVFPVTEFREYRVKPVDVSTTRHFLTDQRISPYLRAGVRYVEAPGDPQIASTFVVYNPGPPPENIAVPVSEGFGLRDRVSAQAAAGLRITLTPRTAIRAEATRLLRSEGVDFDPLTRYAIGVSWLF